MVDFINTELKEIFTEFKEEIRGKDCICELKELDFTDADKFPHYENLLLQKYYLVRYIAGYFTEYSTIYCDIIKKGFLRDRYRVLSLGCGCGLDLWGLIHACEKKLGSGYKKIERYDGIDQVKWKNRYDLKKRLNYNFIIKNVDTMDKLVVKNYNMIMFPKSIGEFSDSEFEHVKYVLEDSEFRDDKMVLICALRKYRREMDLAHLYEIRDIFTSMHGYEVTDEINYVSQDNKSLGSIIDGIDYPREISEYVANLDCKCKNYRKQGYHCQPDCDSVLKRWPVLTRSQFAYDILFLEKRTV